MKFDMGQAWSDTTRLLTANIGMIAIVAGVFFFLPYAAMTLLLTNSLGQMMASDPQNPTAAFDQIFALYSHIWWVFVLVGVGQGIGMLGLLSLLTDRQRPTVGEALLIGAKTFVPYLGAILLLYVLMAFVIGIPVALAYAAGSAALTVIVVIAVLIALLYAMTKFSLIPAVMATEQVLNPVKAIDRSWRLTKGNSVRIFLFYVLLFVVLIVVAIVVSIIAGLLAALLGGQMAIVANGIVSAAVNSAWVALFVAVLAAVHHQLAGPPLADIAETFE